MRHVVGDLLQRVLQGSKLDPQSLLWGILIGACLLSLLHLITMFATRWGDHRVTGKALLFSLMLHFGCLVGVVTVAPAPSLPPGDPEGGEQSHRVMIRSVAAEKERDFGADVGSAGQTPVWDRIAVPGHVKPLGPQPALPAAVATPSVDRVAESLKPPELPPLDVAAMPDVAQPPAATPVPAAPSTSKQSAQTPEIEAPKSAPLAAPSTATAPRPAERSTAPTTTATVDRQATAPTDSPLVPTDTGHLDPPAIPDSTAPAPAPKATVASNSSADPIRRDASPAPVPSPQVDANTNVGQSSSAAGGGTSSIAGPAITPQQSGALAGTVVGRLPSNEVSGTTSGQPEPARVEDYQSVDDRPSPAIQVRRTGTEPLIVKRRRASRRPTACESSPTAGKTPASSAAPNTPSDRSRPACAGSRMQSRDGRWDAKAFGAGKVKIDENGVDRDYAGRDADSGVTALAVLAFLARATRTKRGNTLNRSIARCAG